MPLSSAAGDMKNTESVTPTSRPPLSGIFWGILLNAVVPVALYKLSKRYYSVSEFTALALASAFPLGKSAFELLLYRRSDPISIVVLLGIATDGVAILFGGSPRLLLLRESIFTGTFGVACFVSLLLPRPMMFYLSRSLIAGTDEDRRARFNVGWQLPEMRFCHRLITVVWGCVFVGEFLIRIILIYTLSAELVLIVSPILMGTLTIVTMVWSFSYGYRVRARVLALLSQTPAPDQCLFSSGPGRLTSTP
jgi:hypothetical protein